MRFYNKINLTSANIKIVIEHGHIKKISLSPLILIFVCVLEH